MAEDALSKVLLAADMLAPAALGEAHDHLMGACSWYAKAAGGEKVEDPTDEMHCQPATGKGGAPRLVVKMTPRTPEASTVDQPTVPPGGPGLFHIAGRHLPPYIQHLYKHLVARYGKHGAYRVAVGVVKKWKAGINPGGKHPTKTHPDVKAAAGRNIAQWEQDIADAHADNKVKATVALAQPATNQNQDEHVQSHLRRDPRTGKLLLIHQFIRRHKFCPQCLSAVNSADAERHVAAHEKAHNTAHDTARETAQETVREERAARAHAKAIKSINPKTPKGKTVTAKPAKSKKLTPQDTGLRHEEIAREHEKGTAVKATHEAVPLAVPFTTPDQRMNSAARANAPKGKVLSAPGTRISAQLQQQPSQTVVPSPPLPPGSELPSQGECDSLASALEKDNPDNNPLLTGATRHLRDAGVKFAKKEPIHALSSLRNAQMGILAGHYELRRNSIPQANVWSAAQVPPAANSSAHSAMAQSAKDREKFRGHYTAVSKLIDRTRRHYFHGQYGGYATARFAAEPAPLPPPDPASQSGGKLSHEAVNYHSATDPDECCHKCYMFDQGHCTLVEDPIHPEGVCNRWVPIPRTGSDRRRVIERTLLKFAEEAD